jgi:pyruvate/2-oxoglutarate dehydrogenase complex dihydrolipoamide dehydrogenase (E3) component
MDVTCTVNPAVGREREWGDEQLRRASRQRTVLVVGGGPAGLKAAEVAAQRGHRVTLVEQEAELGGQLRFAAALPHRGDWAHLVEDLAGSLDRLGVDVRLRTEATPHTPDELGAEVTVLATGASWDTSGFSIYRPDRDGIPQTGSVHVLDPTEAIADPDACGQRVMIVDDTGDYTALGLAELLGASGRTVDLVTVFPQVGMRVMPHVTADYAWVYPRLVECGVTIRTQSFVESIEPGSVSVADAWTAATDEIAADTVVLVMTRRTNDGLYQALAERGSTSIRIGDCLAPREVDDATYEGMRCGFTL